MFGSVEKFFYKDLAGISHLAPGFKEIRIKPCIVDDLTYAKASFKSVYGLIESNWEKGEQSFKLYVTIPVNTTGKVWVPKLGLNKITVTESEKNIWKSAKFVAGVIGIAGGIETNDYITFDIGSGSYVFHLVGQ